MIKTLRALYECHQSTPSSYCNKQIAQVCFTYMSQCAEHRLSNLHSWHSLFLFLIHWLLLPCRKVHNANYYASLKHLYSYICFSLSYFDLQQESTQQQATNFVPTNSKLNNPSVLSLNLSVTRQSLLPTSYAKLI